MRDVFIIIFILVMIIGSMIYLNKYLDKTSTSLVSSVKKLEDNIQKNSLTNEELINQMEEIYRKWEQINNSWSNIILHEEIDLIQTSLIRTKSKIQIGDVKESIEDIETSIFLINHIKEKEKTSLKNIF